MSSYSANIIIGDQQYYDYNSFSDYKNDWSDPVGNGLVTPAIVSVHDKITSSDLVPGTSGGDTPDHVYKLYDLLLWDKTNKKEVIAIYTNATDYGIGSTSKITVYDVDDRTTGRAVDTSDVIPVGLCVIPTNTFSESPKARFISLKLMGFASFSSDDSYTYGCIIPIADTLIHSYDVSFGISYGNISALCWGDPGYYIHNKLSSNNFFEVDGTYAQKYVYANHNNSYVQENKSLGYVHMNNSYLYFYPAFLACEYYAVDKSLWDQYQHTWYLPSISEIQYGLHSNLDNSHKFETILNILGSLHIVWSLFSLGVLDGAISVSSIGNCWSSTEFDTNYAFSSYYDGNPYYSSKYYTYCTFAFLQR